MGQKVSVPPASITRLPDHFTKAALESGWFEFGVSVMPKPLIQIIADYYSNRGMCLVWSGLVWSELGPGLARLSSAESDCSHDHLVCVGRESVRMARNAISD